MEEVIHHKPVGVYPISNNNSLLFYDIEYGINDIAIVKFNGQNKVHKLRIYYNLKGNPFIKLYNTRYYLNEFYRV